jgi:Divergent InlB B-repeat domain
MVRAALAAVLVSLAASGGGAQGGAQARVELGLGPTGFGGAVLVNPTGALTRCDGPRCFYSFEAGTVVTLTTTISDRGTSFARWLGACTGSAQSCTVTMDRSRLVTARFSPVRLYLEPKPEQGSVTKRPNGTSCGAGCTSYPYGTRVELEATSCCGYSLERWTGMCAPRGSSNTCAFNIHDTTETSPVYYCSSGDCLGVSRSPLSRDVKAKLQVQGSGRVKINGKDCSGPCDFVFTRGQPLVLRAYTEGSSFLGWEGTCRGRDPRCQFTAFNHPNGSPPSVVARFG